MATRATVSSLFEGKALAGEIDHLEAVARTDGAVAVGFQQVVEELHVQLVVLHDHYCLRHLSRRAAGAFPSSDRAR
jgi:hypothetical protein